MRMHDTLFRATLATSSIAHPHALVWEACQARPDTGCLRQPTTSPCRDGGRDAVARQRQSKVRVYKDGKVALREASVDAGGQAEGDKVERRWRRDQSNGQFGSPRIPEGTTKDELSKQCWRSPKHLHVAPQSMTLGHPKHLGASIKTSHGVHVLDDLKGDTGWRGMCFWIYVLARRRTWVVAATTRRPDHQTIRTLIFIVSMWHAPQPGRPCTRSRGGLPGGPTQKCGPGEDPRRPEVLRALPKMILCHKQPFGPPR